MLGCLLIYLAVVLFHRRANASAPPEPLRALRADPAQSRTHSGRAHSAPATARALAALRLGGATALGPGTGRSPGAHQGPGMTP